jgi:hypothetical protein
VHAYLKIKSYLYYQWSYIWKNYWNLVFFPYIKLISLQDFTFLSMKIFRRCVIRSSSVIYLPTSSPTDSVRRLSLRRWFPISSLYRSEKQKNHLPIVLQTEFARQKKSFPLEIYRQSFIPSVISGFTDGYVPLVQLSMSVWNTDRIYLSVNSSVSVAATVKCRRIKFVGEVVDECLKYRPNISVCKCVGECYCQMPTDSLCR